MHIDLQGEARVVLAGKLFSALPSRPTTAIFCIPRFCGRFLTSSPWVAFLAHGHCGLFGPGAGGCFRAGSAEHAPDFNAVRPGRRYACWREDEACTVLWLEARDGGDPRQPATRDVLMQKVVGEEPRVF